MTAMDFARKFQELHLTESQHVRKDRLFNLAESHIERAGLLGLSKDQVKLENRALLENRKLFSWTKYKI